MMTSLKQFLHQGQVGLTVYSPDAVHSHLWRNLDHDIHTKTGLKVGYRQWIYHDVGSIEAFYRDDSGQAVEPEPNRPKTINLDDIPVEKLRAGHFVVKLFTSGPSLLTLWHGEGAIPQLLTLKGRTHPADAQPHSIRGRFWCDNAVCNLLHTSDDAAEAEREIKALRLGHLLDAEPVMGQLAEARLVDKSYIGHSSIVILCEVVNRLLATTDAEPLLIELPESGDARETMQQLSQLLNATATTTDSHIATLIRAYFAGDLVAVTAMLKTLPITSWEHFVLQCGVLSMDKWRAAGV